MIRFWCSLVAIALLLTPFIAFADYDDEIEEEIASYINIFELPFRMNQHTAAEALAYAGYSDPRIFDLIEKQLLDNYQNLDDSYDIDWASWLVKALGFSGNSKYISTIEFLATDAPDSKLRKYSKVGKEYLGKYSKWNIIITKNDLYDNSLPLSLNRYANMLRSDQPELHKLASKRIFFEGIQEDKITDLVNYRISNPTPKTDRDTKKWLKKSLCTECTTFGSRP